MRAIVYYMTTTVLAVILGIILVVTIHPGVAGQERVGFNIKHGVINAVLFEIHCARNNWSHSLVNY